MKVIPIALEPQYSSGSSTLCYCLHIERADGTVIAATSADVDIEVDSVTYSAVNGLDVSALVFQAGLAVNNLELTVIPDDEGDITEADLLTGLWDNARFELFETNYLDPTDGKNVLLQGVMGEVSLQRGAYTVEMRALSQFLNQPIGIVTSKTCRYLFGVNNGTTSLCPVDLAPLTLTHTVTSAASRQVFTASGAVQASDYYSEGRVTFLTGENAGYSRRVKSFASGVFTVDLPFPYEIAAGDTFTAVKGCRKRKEDCISNDAYLDFGGEPEGRGIDVITANPEPDE
jgi:uncharacterized phage protein (TIGR02218 family)